MRAWARVSRAAATIFIARVIFWVDLTVEIRLRMALSEATFSALLHGGLEFGVERFDRRVEALLQIVVEDLLLGDVAQQRFVARLEGGHELGLVPLQRFDRELVEIAGSAGVDD